MSETLELLQNERRDLEKKLVSINERIDHEKVFEILRRDVKPYFDEAEKEMRITNLKMACDNILKALKSAK
jgi:hypothetical protein